MTSVLIRREEETQRQKDRQGIWPCEDKDRGWSDSSISQGTPQISNNL